MGGTLSLAASIAAMDRTELERLAAGRRVVSPASVHDPLSFAIELLRPESIARALQGLHRESLEALLALARGGDADREILPELTAAGLVGLDTDTGRPVPLPELDGPLGGIELHAEAEHERGSAPPADTSAWYGAALTSVRRAAEVLFATGRHPVRLGRKGQPAVASVRELAEAAHCEPEPIARLLDAMRAAGLLEEMPGHTGAPLLGTTVTAMDDWLVLDYPRRWLVLARAAVSTLDARLRRGVERTGPDLRAVVGRLPHDYPLLPEAELESLARAADTAEDLGLTVDGRLTPAATALLQAEPEAALAIAETDLPDPVRGIYLQPDLSIVVPGPLPHEDELLLHAIAETEQLGPAASLRVGTDRLGRAVRRGGYTAAGIREQLQRLSLTGVPQPLEYLLRELAAKFDDPGAEAQGEAGRNRADSVAEPPPAPQPASQSTSRPAPRNRHAERAETAAARDPREALVDRVYAAVHEAGSEDDLTRRLKLAIRDRSAVQVTAVAGSSRHVFTLMPVSLQGGRLRATDQQAGVERTLPVSAITAVEAA